MILAGFLVGLAVGAGIVLLIYGAIWVDVWEARREVKWLAEVAKEGEVLEAEKSVAPAPLLSEGFGFPLTR